MYNEKLKNSCCVLPVIAPRVRPSWHQFVVKVRNRDEVAWKVAALRIQTSIHYPIPIFDQKAHETSPFVNTCNTESVRQDFNEILSIPICPTLSEFDAVMIADALLVVQK